MISPYKEALAFPPVEDLTTEGAEVERTVEIRPGSISFAPAQGMPAARLWTYGGHYPGPTFIVRQRQTVHVRWINKIPHNLDPKKGAVETLPFRVVTFPDPDPKHVPPIPIAQNSPGAPADDGDGVKFDKVAAKLTASTVTHLHGGRAAPDSDGWTENVARHGQTQHATYPNNQRGTMLWYHDHALGITRLNVYAGLAGFWLIRDDVEKKLIADNTLPGGKDEICLLLQDRNFEADANGNPNGTLLHKNEQTTAEMFGPYTLVNGVLWPRCAVGPGRVRVRIVNGSNARTYCLRLIEGIDQPDGSVTPGPNHTDDAGLIWQIGSDGGLFDFPVPPTSLAPTGDPKNPTTNRGIVLAPAERVDLVIDFSRFAKTGGRLDLVNTAFAPFHGSTVTYPFNGVDDNGQPIPEQLPDGTNATAGKAGDAAPDFRLPNPYVMRFEVQPAVADNLPGSITAKPLQADTPLDPQFLRYVHKAGDSRGPGVPRGRKELVLPAKHNHRWIALTEFPPGHLFFRELEAVTTDAKTAASTGLSLIAIQSADGKTTTWYRTTAMAFHDALRIEIKYGGWEVWNLINLTTDTHPVHLHLVEFQVLSRQACDPLSGGPAGSTSNGYIVGGGYTLPGQPILLKGAPFLPDLNEQGAKDTVRVNPNEVLSLAAQFVGFCGRYMYHCHILEHEDMDMMRPFIVLPADELAEMGDMDGMGGMVM